MTNYSVIRYLRMLKRLKAKVMVLLCVHQNLDLAILCYNVVRTTKYEGV